VDAKREDTEKREDKASRRSNKASEATAHKVESKRRGKGGRGGGEVKTYTQSLKGVETFAVALGVTRKTTSFSRLPSKTDSP
jgi:hypothetical protein